MDENFRYVNTSLISANDCRVKEKLNYTLRKNTNERRIIRKSHVIAPNSITADVAAVCHCKKKGRIKRLLSP